MQPLFLVLVFVVGVIDTTYSPQELKCSVCKRVMQEMEKEISKVDPNKKINLSHRINDKGKVVDKSRPFARSEVHLSELMDVICEKMENYVRAKNRTTGKLEVIPLITDSGGMNPNFSDYEIIQDSDLNKSLKFYCEGIVEEFDSEIFNVLREETEEAAEIKFCVEASGLCSLPLGVDRNEL